ncbi:MULTISPECIES: hypothetical protein [Actinosynnema]|uniref:hypothetical protein n=1 Tax=Actinosynnema TaxID=40566 RepID=UPI0020A4B2F0|nr:hypothetical protein [Actinosynnema pretiosum]MCP2096010.1 hypothetical protein [Actinosynnema pretiosum]
MAGPGAFPTPWLVVYGYGDLSYRLAQRAADQLRASGATTWLTTIQEVAPATLPRFRGAVLVLPTSASAASNRRTNAARARFTELAAALAPCATHVLHVGAPADLAPFPEYRALRPRVRAVHHVPRSTAPALDVLRLLVDSENRAHDERSAALWAHAREWGVTTTKQVEALLAAVAERRARYEERRFHQARRPHPDYDLNRLDLLLDHPDAAPPRRPWMSAVEHGRVLDGYTESGARVTRDTMRLMRAACPTFARPTDRTGKKGAQSDLRDIHRTLTALSRLQEDAPTPT